MAVPFYSLAIWTCYYMQLYVAFSRSRSHGASAPVRRSLSGWSPCLVAFVLSSIGMAVPASNGGLGPWNIAVMFGLAVYGVSDAQGTAFSMLQWSGHCDADSARHLHDGLHHILRKKRKRTPSAGTVAARGGKTMNYES